MKKIIIVFIFIINHIVALDKDSTIKIYNDIMKSIFVKYNHIYVYVPNKEYHQILKLSKVISIVDDINKASIAVVTDKLDLKHIKKNNPNMMLFVTKEKLLFEDKTIIGAFYWKKGRSQLIFIKDRLDKYHIKLPTEYNQFIIEL